MSSLLGLFACCLRSHPGLDGSPDERSRIFNGRDTPIYVPRDGVSADRRKIKERLDNIVRSKESKMVNVTDHLPFNLQNRAASTSRIRAESPSPHPSVVTTGTTTTSHSDSSHKPGGGRFGSSKQPALRVRLVRGRDNSYHGSSSRDHIGKKFGDEIGVEWSRIDGVNWAESSSDSKGPQMLSDLDAAPPEILLLEDSDRENLLALSAEIGKHLKDGWKIKDTGPVSRGWGD